MKGLKVEVATQSTSSFVVGWTHLCVVLYIHLFSQSHDCRAWCTIRLLYSLLISTGRYIISTDCYVGSLVMIYCTTPFYCYVKWCTLSMWSRVFLASSTTCRWPPPWWFDHQCLCTIEAYYDLSEIENNIANIQYISPYYDQSSRDRSTMLWSGPHCGMVCGQEIYM